MLFKPRKSGIRDKNKTLWIFCGGKTEKLYFSSFKVRNGNNIKSKYNGVAGINLLKDSLREISKIQNKDKLDIFYIVFDRDPDNNTKKQIKDILLGARKNNIIPIISNRSFELWFILHFDEFNRAVSSNSEYLSILSTKLGYPYSKTDHSLGDSLRDKLEIAVINSKALEDAYINDGVSELEFTEPYTNVYVLINDLVS